MQRTKILGLCFEGAVDAGPSLQRLIAAEGRFNFVLWTEVLRPGEFQADRFGSSIARIHPDAVVFFLPSNWQPLRPILEAARKLVSSKPVLFVMECSDPACWGELLEMEPDDFITAPCGRVEVLARLIRLTGGTAPKDPLVGQLKEKLGLRQLIGESPALISVVAKIPAVARCDATVLLAGETGTGKEMFARAIHHLSPRADKPFMPVNCGALPAELVENELFGHEAGAFTGAHSAAAGLLQKSESGSLLLDEIDSLPLAAQVKLLRFLQEKEFRPLGSGKACQVNVRVIAASNANLEDAVRKGRLREDLYFRLNVITLILPPLRERKDDIPLLARHFVAKYAAAFGTPARDLSPGALQKLRFHEWPGNVRELENVIERSVVFASRRLLEAPDIDLKSPVSVEEGDSFQSIKAKLIARFERGYILDLLLNHNGNISRAAVAAGKNRRAFWELMRKHDIRGEPHAQSRA